MSHQVADCKLLLLPDNRKSQIALVLYEGNRNKDEEAGVGLFLAKEISAIRASSGQGSDFTITLRSAGAIHSPTLDALQQKTVRQSRGRQDIASPAAGRLCDL